MSKAQFFKILIAVGLAVVALFVPFAALGVNVNPIEQRVIALFVLAAFLWILEPIPIWSTSILIIVLMLFTMSDKAPAPMLVDASGEKFTNLLSYKAVMATFADPTIMLFLGGFFLAAASTKYKLDLNLARVLLKPFGRNPKYVLLGLMMITAMFSMFMSNTATAAMMLAILAPVLALFDANDKGRMAFVLAIPIGANIGGMGTPIGTPPNAIAMKAMDGAVSFGKWMFFATPYMIVILIAAWIFLVKVFPSTKKSMELTFNEKFMKTPKAIIAYVTFALTILLWVTSDLTGLDSNVVAMVPIAVFSVTRVISAKDMNGMSWDVLWLVAGGFALGLGLEKTGLAKHLLEAIPFGSWNVYVVFLGVGLIGLFMSTFMSNTAACALLTPIVAALAVSMGPALGPLGGAPGIIITVALCCSLAMSLPISTPPNALAYGTGFVETKQMAKVGVFIGIFGIAVVFGMMMLLGTLKYFN